MPISPITSIEFQNAEAFSNEFFRLRREGYNPRLFTSGSFENETWYIEYGDSRAVASAPPQASVVTGIDPSEIHNALYGKVIPLSALGLARIGTAGLIFGPYFNAGAASFAVSFGFPANPAGTRRVYEVSLDGKVAWENAAGSPAGALGSGFISDPFTCRFYSGTQTQGADPLETAMFGAQAVAYRPQMMLWFENLPVAAFDGKVPFVSAKIGDVTDHSINLGSALEMFAYSPWLEYDSSSFETTGVADIVQGMILTEDQSFLDLLRVTGRVYRTLDILQTDKLRVVDRGSTVAPDLQLQRNHIAADAGVQYNRREESSVPRELELITIDPDADYVFMPSKAARPRAPVPVTSSVAKDTITLPVVIGATTRASLVTYAKYQEDNARKHVSLQTMLYGYALEPGDLFRLRDIAADFDQGEVFKVVESSHGANYINEIIGEAILKCGIAFTDSDPYFASVVLLLHGESSAPVLDSSAYDQTMILMHGATIDVSRSVFGGASFSFSNVFAAPLEGDFVKTNTGTDFQYDISPTNTSPYTIELWAWFDIVGRPDIHQMLIAKNEHFGSRLWSLYNPMDGDQDLVFVYWSGVAAPWTATIPTTGANLVTDRWYHIAVDKDSTGKIRIYVDGVMKAGTTPADSVIYHQSSRISVGADGLGDYPFIGNIDDVRITAASRYGDVYGDGGFDVPTEQFPDNAP